MTPKQKAIRQRLKDDYPHYAAKCLKIRTKTAVISEGKSQKIIPFVFNRAQKYIHLTLETQKKVYGYVRALLLKGRQQGCCLDPETKILTADLKWVPAKDITPGMELVSTDESIHPGLGKGLGCRKMRTAIVEKVWAEEMQAYRMVLDDGREVICSGNHRWLSRKSQSQLQWRSIDGSGQWPDKRDALQVGDIIWSITTIWGDSLLEDYWFGGVTDGEGSMDYVNRTGVRVAVSQRANVVYDRMTAYCEFRDFGQFVITDQRKGQGSTSLGNSDVHAINISGMSEVFRLLGLTRPSRFIGVDWWEGKRMPDGGSKKIMSIEPIGTRILIDIHRFRTVPDVDSSGDPL